MGTVSPGSSVCRGVSYPKRWWALLVLCFAGGILAVDTTVLNFAIPAISAELTPSATQMLWIVDVYAFTLASLLVTMGTLGDVIGRKRLLLAGTACFGAASAACAVCTIPLLLIICRAIQGAAAATLMPSTLSLIRVMFEDSKERARAISLWSTSFAIGAAVGPLLGGTLLKFFHWGSVFLVNVPFAVFIIVGGWFLLPKSRAESRGRFDILGAFLSMVMLFSLVFSLKMMAVERTISPAYVVVGLCGLCVGYCLFRHLRRVDYPLFDIDLLRQRTYATVVVINGASTFLYVGILYYFSQFLQVVMGMDAVRSAFVLIPALILEVVATLLTGLIMHRFPARNLLVVAYGVMAVGAAIIALDGAHVFTRWGGAVLWLAVGYAVLLLGVGMTNPVAGTYVVAHAPKDRAGAASAISETGYELGSALGTAVLGSVLMIVYAVCIDREPRFSSRAGESLVSAHELAGADSSLRSVADMAFAHGVVAASSVACVVACVMVVLICRNIPKELAH